jgi:catechol 2,3-dioxygenase-like lactoylglutathione lyase family enzyme
MQFDNIDLIVKDVDRAVDFYHGVLGLPFFLPYEPEETWAAVQAGSVTIYIFQTSSEVSAPPRRFDARADPPGWSLIGLRVDDLDETVARFDGTVRWVAPERSWKHPSGTWYRFRGVYDPEGNIVSFSEAHQDEA